MDHGLLGCYEAAAARRNKAHMGRITGREASSSSEIEVAGHAPVVAESSHGSVRSPPSSPGTIAHTPLPSAAGFVADGEVGRRGGEDGSPLSRLLCLSRRKREKGDRREATSAEGDDVRASRRCGCCCCREDHR
nr:hypothetical protein Iba_chr09bCG12000 [Ipomoea batatas]